MAPDHGIVAVAFPPVLPDRLHWTYSTALRLITVATDAASAGVVESRSLAVYQAVCRATQEARDTICETLAPLLALADPQRERLLEAAWAYYDAHGDLGEAAKALCIVPRSLRYRLDKITELTGWSFADPKLTTECMVGLHLARLDHGDREARSPEQPSAEPVIARRQL
jgi:DNA-binding PucR family transcriptional regulator